MRKTLRLLMLFTFLSPAWLWAEEMVVETPVEPAALSAPATVVDDELGVLAAQKAKKQTNPMLTILAWSILVAAAGFGAVVAARRRGGINPAGKKGNPLF